MRFATIEQNGQELAAIVTDVGVLTMAIMNRQRNTPFATTLFEIIENGQLKPFQDWFEKLSDTDMLSLLEYAIPLADVNFCPLYRHPRKIWGIGLNYVEHAADLHEKAPNTEPASFMKPDTTIIGPNDTIEIPQQSNRTTGEAELGIVIGQACKDVEEDEAHQVIAGFTTLIDMTAEDILEKNPRYLTRSKSFDTFFSFGPELVTPDEVQDVHQLHVATVKNGEIHRRNVIANMTFNPWFLVSFHSKVMQLLPGDIIATGTPGAIVLRDGDMVECQIDGFTPLRNSVRDLKVR